MTFQSMAIIIIGTGIVTCLLAYVLIYHVLLPILKKYKRITIQPDNEEIE